MFEISPNERVEEFHEKTYNAVVVSALLVFFGIIAPQASVTFLKLVPDPVLQKAISNPETNAILLFHFQLAALIGTVLTLIVTCVYPAFKGKSGPRRAVNTLILIVAFIFLLLFFFTETFRSQVVFRTSASIGSIISTGSLEFWRWFFVIAGVLRSLFQLAY